MSSHWERGGQERYAIYVRKPPRFDLVLMATTGTKEGVGTALVTLGEEDEFVGGRVGVLDTGEDGGIGRWLANPFA